MFNVHYNFNEMPINTIDQYLYSPSSKSIISPQTPGLKPTEGQYHSHRSGPGSYLIPWYSFFSICCLFCKQEYHKKLVIIVK